MPANQRSGQLNSSRLLRAIWMNRGISRIELARSLELDKSTVTLLVNKMLKQGVLEVLSGGNSGPRGGRKPQALGIRSGYGYYLGLELLPRCIRFAIVDLEGAQVEQGEIRAESVFSFFDDSLSRQIEALFWEKAESYNLLGVGIALSGIIDPFEGRILQSYLFDIKEPLDLTSIIEDRIHCSIMLDNDANCCAWGELVQNKERSLSDFLYILIESDLLELEKDVYNRLSLGMGIVFDGKVFHGKQFSSGEFKSILWKENQKNSQFSMGLEQLQRFKDDKQLRNRLFREIGQNIAFLTNTLNLNQLYVGGDFYPYWDELQQILDDEIQRNWSYPDRVRCSCSLSSQGVFAAAYGAAAMHLERVFASHQAPFYQERSQKIGLEALDIE